MRTLITLAIGLSILVGFAPLARAASDKGIVEQVKEGCKAELDSYCKQVTPGEGRLLACLFAFEDKLSSRCDYALYDASMRLERASAAFSHGAVECHADIEKLCTGVKAGEGRIFDCLKGHQDELSKRCRQAFKIA